MALLLGSALFVVKIFQSRPALSVVWADVEYTIFFVSYQISIVMLAAKEFTGREFEAKVVHFREESRAYQIASRKL
jgi:hypothetical protein